MKAIDNTSKIKELLRKYEIAQAKVEYDFNDRTINPAQQAAATRMYNRLYDLKDSMNMTREQLLVIHREVIEELNLTKL